MLGQVTIVVKAVAKVASMVVMVSIFTLKNHCTKLYNMRVGALYR